MPSAPCAVLESSPSSAARRMKSDRPAAALRGALAELLAGCDISGCVRDEIRDSWQRSAVSGLTPNRVEVRVDPDIDGDGSLARIARPVLEQLALDLDAVPVGIILASATGEIVDVRAAGGPLAARLGRVLLAPGSVYAENLVGTNGIGTALAQRKPVVVEGAEHFAEALTTLACAGAPISDLRSGRLLGVIGLASLAEDWSALMLPLAMRAAREVEHRVVDTAGVSERLMVRRFLHERRRAKGPFVFINEQRMITNAAADRLVAPGDEATLWDCARRLLAGGPAGSVRLVLRGVAIDIRCEPVLDGSAPLGALLRLRPISDPLSDASDRGPSRRPFGWESLTDTEESVIDLVARGLTNRQVAEHLFISRHTVDFHLRAIFRKLDVTSRVDLTRFALEHRAPAQ
jgi:DNA-binding CsgD family transcriptional regulator